MRKVSNTRIKTKVENAMSAKAICKIIQVLRCFALFVVL